MKITLQTSIIIFMLWIVGCASSRFEQPYGLLAELRVEDVLPLPSTREPSLQEIAFTFPVFEMGAEETLASIKRGDAQVEVSNDTWTLWGDGAQTTVKIVRLSPSSSGSLRVALSLGPVFDGGISSSLPLYHYQFTRESTGWVRTHYKREMKKVEQAAP